MGVRCGVERVRQHRALVAHRLQSVGGFRVLGVRDDVRREPDDAAGDAQHRRGGGVPCPVPQRGQQHASDLVQGEGVRARTVGLPVHGRDVPDGVLGEPQQDERQLRGRLHPPSGVGAAARLQCQEGSRSPAPPARVSAVYGAGSGTASRSPRDGRHATRGVVPACSAGWPVDRELSLPNRTRLTGAERVKCGPLVRRGRPDRDPLSSSATAPTTAAFSLDHGRYRPPSDRGQGADHGGVRGRRRRARRHGRSGAAHRAGEPLRPRPPAHGPQLVTSRGRTKHRTDQEPQAEAVSSPPVRPGPTPRGFGHEGGRLPRPRRRTWLPG